MCDDAKHLSERLERLERVIEALSTGDAAAPVHDEGSSGASKSARARREVRATAGTAEPDTVHAIATARKLRLRYFDHDLFFDPAWAILIDLYQTRLRGQRLSVSAVCYGSGVSETTALRYIGVLEQRGYIERVSDETDKRRAFLRLTASAHDKLTRYFAEVRKNWAG